MKEKAIAIAIDGPAAAGKSTVAKQIAEKLAYIYIDTGAMYRAITLKALDQQVNINDEMLINQLLAKTKIELSMENKKQVVRLDGQDVTDEIRSQDVTNSVSQIATYASIRKEMVARQQQLAQNRGVVMDGRDIGTHVLPDAEVKIFLIASVEERAKRRFEENKTRGIHTDLEVLKKEIKNRDELDMSREVSPLVKAEDAIEVDTSFLSIDEVVDHILSIVMEYMNKRR